MNLALDTADSYWNGAATNAGADKLGVFNLVLKMALYGIISFGQRPGM